MVKCTIYTSSSISGWSSNHIKQQVRCMIHHLDSSKNKWVQTVHTHHLKIYKISINTSLLGSVWNFRLDHEQTIKNLACTIKWKLISWSHHWVRHDNSEGETQRTKCGFIEREKEREREREWRALKTNTVGSRERESFNGRSVSEQSYGKWDLTLRCFFLSDENYESVKNDYFSPEQLNLVTLRHVISFLFFIFW